MPYFIMIEKNGATHLNGNVIYVMSMLYQSELKAHFGYSDVLEFDFEEEYFHSYKKFYCPSVYMIEGKSYCVYMVSSKSDLIKFSQLEYLG